MVKILLNIQLECVDHLRDNKEGYRTFRLFGQEKNLTPSSIARMNMFLHGIEDFQIFRGDTLLNSAFFEADGSKTFDCVIANPPFSLKDWGADLWINDRNNLNHFIIQKRVINNPKLAVQLILASNSLLHIQI